MKLLCVPVLGGADCRDDGLVLKKNVESFVRARRKVLRKQQLSQGVLTHLLKMLGRASVFQVDFSLPYLFPPITARNICSCRALQDPCLVLDPFAGTCSTGIAALATGNYSGVG